MGTGPFTEQRGAGSAAGDASGSGRLTSRGRLVVRRFVS